MWFSLLSLSQVFFMLCFLQTVLNQWQLCVQCSFTNNHLAFFIIFNSFLSFFGFFMWANPTNPTCLVGSREIIYISLESSVVFLSLPFSWFSALLLELWGHMEQTALWLLSCRRILSKLFQARSLFFLLLPPFPRPQPVSTALNVADVWYLSHLC